MARSLREPLGADYWADFGKEFPSVAEWQAAVAADETRLGYLAWVEDQA
jgi:hypothetical protein